ncbi:MAG: DUF3566 domain-containing protein [Actinomycetales bacterium]|uniref:DUF3566 domain-containing protein n=2 Tax=Candidatus Phosphoribacter hodrii TaxID=2953743 RepID=A0A934X6T8_9MICO|nr:DUF3566 domain-containing protein [Candidatus Phosphoribacter hodrii]
MVTKAVTDATAPRTRPNPAVSPSTSPSASPSSNGGVGTGAGAGAGVGGGAAAGATLPTGRPAPARPGGSAGPAAGPAAKPAARAGATTTAPRTAPRPTGRRVRLAVARIDPWSAMKMSFLLSFAAGVGLVVATMVLWMILSGMNVFNDIDGLVRSLQPNSADPFSIMDWIGFPRVTSLSMVIAVIDVILLTALGTLGAYLYNICASLVGGVQLTLTDD